MNILITGIHGFVGSNLVRQLSKNHQLYGIDITSQEKEGVINTFSWADLDTVAIPHADVIIHLAGKAHDTKNYTEAPVYFEVNTGLTKKIFDYFMHSGTQKFIFFSSVKAVADTVDGYELTEDEPPHPKGPYAESKRKAEEYIIDNFPELAVSYQLSVVSNQQSVSEAPSAERKASSNHETSEPQSDCHVPVIETPEPRTQNPEQKKVYILRPTMIHGPGNKGNLNLLYKVVKKGIPWLLGVYNNRRSFTSIDNLTYVIEQLIEKAIPSGIYNMADDEAISTNELIGIISEALHRKPLIVQVPKPIIRAFASLGSILHLPLNNDRLQKLTENYVVSNAKIKAVLGINIMPVKAGEGLRRTVEGFRV